MLRAHKIALAPNNAQATHLARACGVARFATLSENVIVPIAGLVITYVLCYELISMIIDKNNLHELDTFMFFK